MAVVGRLSFVFISRLCLWFRSGLGQDEVVSMDREDGIR